MFSEVLLVLVVASWITATISGFLGMAGGMTLLAVMTIVLPPALVVPLHGVVQLCSNFSRTAAFLRHVRWRIFFVYAPPLIIGVYGATLLWQGDKLDWFKPAIGVFVLAFLVWRRVMPKLRKLPLWTYAPLGVVTGFLSIFVGATGPFIAPFFLRDDLSKEQVIANKAVCQTWLHLLKIPAFLSLGFDYMPHASLLAAMIIAVVVGTFTGKWLLTRVSRETFVRAFEAVLAAVGVYLILA